MLQKMIYCDAYRQLLAELRCLRIERHMRQEDVGKRIGLSGDWVGRIEQAQLRLDLLHLVRLSRVYGVPADELVRRFAERLPQ